MRTRRLCALLLAIAWIALSLPGCGTPQPPPEQPAPEPSTPEVPAPPGGNDVIIDPSAPNVTINSQNVTFSQTLNGTNKLTPLAFGNVQTFEIKLNGAPAPIAIKKASIPYSSGKTLVIEGAPQTDASWKVNGMAQQAYDPAQHGNDKFLWPEELKTPQASGKISFWRPGAGSQEEKADVSAVEKVRIK